MERKGKNLTRWGELTFGFFNMARSSSLSACPVPANEIK